jgi:UDP-N-acetylglucosamine--N-acetylmuramyl-(pentapeptide) pyrophosphoryl-undecaprenol N-acetylglucosamine transferase
VASAAPLVLIAGGGTGGHLYPGLALADALVASGVRVAFVGTATGLEARVVPETGHPLHLLRSRQLRGGGVARAAVGGIAAARSVAGALGLVHRLRPRLVVGVGGYASVAGALAARLARLPVVLMEQNVVPGAATRFLARIARPVCVGFAEAAAYLPPGRSVHTGNPIRAEVLRARTRAPRARPGLLVFGGSAGARHVNEVTVDALARLGPVARDLDVIHQTGTADAPTVRARYDERGLRVRVEAFISDMGAAYAEADVVVARSGAMTCAEVTALGLPAVLVPYPHAADDHQRRNAEVLVNGGAAVMILDRELTGERLATALEPLLTDRRRREEMANRARALGRPDAAERVASECLRLLRG